MLASGHRSPLLESELVDPERDPDELAAIASKAYLGHVEDYLSTTQPPCDTETTISNVSQIATSRHRYSMCS